MRHGGGCHVQLEFDGLFEPEAVKYLLLELYENETSCAAIACMVTLEASSHLGGRYVGFEASSSRAAHPRRSYLMKDCTNQRQRLLSCVIGIDIPW